MLINPCNPLWCVHGGYYYYSATLWNGKAEIQMNELLLGETTQQMRFSLWLHYFTPAPKPAEATGSLSSNFHKGLLQVCGLLPPRPSSNSCTHAGFHCCSWKCVKATGRVDYPGTFLCWHTDQRVILPWAFSDQAIACLSFVQCLLLLGTSKSVVYILKSGGLLGNRKVMVKR